MEFLFPHPNPQMSHLCGRWSECAVHCTYLLSAVDRCSVRKLMWLKLLPHNSQMHVPLSIYLFLWRTGLFLVTTRKFHYQFSLTAPWKHMDFHMWFWWHSLFVPNWEGENYSFFYWSNEKWLLLHFMTQPTFVWTFVGMFQAMLFQIKLPSKSSATFFTFKWIIGAVC